MYDIRQFRPTLYLLLMLGISGFCHAAELGGLWVLSMAALGIHALVSRKGRRTAIPSWAAAALALGFGYLTLQRFLSEPAYALLAAGQFLVLLQLVKVYQEGASSTVGENRNYVWLIVLSLLLIAAACISTASLLFGVITLVYLFVGLYCCLLFHLKIETETLRVAMTIPVEVVNPAVLRQDERLLPASMRKLTVLVAAAGLTCAVVVFVLFPRGAGAGLLGQLNLRPAKALTGFSEQVSFESVARITQSTERVGTVRVVQNGKDVAGTMPIYLRGVTLDYYSGNGRDDAAPGFPSFQTAAPWQWMKSGNPPAKQYTPMAGDQTRFGLPGLDESESYDQTIKLDPLTGSNVLFAMPGAFEMKVGRDTHFSFTPGDETLRLFDNAPPNIEYEVRSRGVAGFLGSPDDLSLPRRGGGAYVRSNIDPAITAYARRPDVSGTDEQGRSLAALRGDRARPSPLDVPIARKIETHLRSGLFYYSLDLTDTQRTPGKDPIVQFLYETRRGHCEYFAGAMVLLCQSLGIEARLVTGYRCDEYNALIGRYVVRQSDAHAWVEVRDGASGRWITFDPTSANEAPSARRGSMASRFRRVLDFLEYTWADTVVSYNRERRDNLLESVQQGVNSTASSATMAVRSWDTLLPDPSRWWISPRLVGGVIMAMVLIGVGAIGYFAWETIRLRRRAERIGIGDLPDDDRRRLARQLGFYDDLLRMLGERGYVRSASQTPLEFSYTLAHLPAEAYDAVHRLTRIYYRIRYGRAELNSAYQRRVREALGRLEPVLGPPPPRPPRPTHSSRSAGLLRSKRGATSRRDERPGEPGEHFG